jgi:hypothetical protein
MSDSSFQWDRDDLHVVVGMSVEPAAAFYDVVVQDAERAKMYFFRVMPVAKAKRVMAVQPAKVDVASFRGRIKCGLHKYVSNIGSLIQKCAIIFFAGFVIFISLVIVVGAVLVESQFMLATQW